ncbi:MAG: LysR family transcriptional regulator [Pseudomonadota bacterium]
MDIRQLRYFIAISEERSLSAASQRLGVAQPSLSQHVIKLESEFNVALIERSSRGILLTEAGELLVRHARGICAGMDRCVEEVRHSGSILRGPVALGIPPSISMVMSVPLAETIRLELPQVRLQAIEAMSGFIKAWIEDHTVEIGFLYDLDNKSHFRAAHILDEELCLFSAPDNWPLDTPPGQPVRLADLRHLEMILPSPTHGLRKTIDRYAQSQGIALSVVIEMDAMTQIKELVARGSGHTILSPAASNDFVMRGELVTSPIVAPVMQRPVYLAHNPDRAMSPACSAVRRIAIDVARELVGRGIWKARLSPELSRDRPPDP